MSRFTGGLFVQDWCAVNLLRIHRGSTVSWCSLGSLLTDKVCLLTMLEQIQKAELCYVCVCGGGANYVICGANVVLQLHTQNSLLFSAL